MGILKVLLVPAALAFATAATTAAPASPGGTAPAEVLIGIEATPAHDSRYYHEHRYKPQRRNTRYRYNYAPRCHWSNYYQRRI